MSRIIGTSEELRRINLGEKINIRGIADAVYVGENHEGLPTIAYLDGQNLIEESFWILRRQNPLSNTPQNKIQQLGIIQRIDSCDLRYPKYLKYLKP
ncbi:MAG: hypothetical protein KKC19_04060 [Nanoarchaeota archaeon]|nr:hypothetical protein [Nanoarchaeota archaeon]